MLVINKLEKKEHGYDYKVGNIKSIKITADFVEVLKRGGTGRGEVLRYRRVK